MLAVEAGTAPEGFSATLMPRQAKHGAGIVQGPRADARKTVRPPGPNLRMEACWRRPRFPEEK